MPLNNRAGHTETEIEEPIDIVLAFVSGMATSMPTIRLTAGHQYIVLFARLHL